MHFQSYMIPNGIYCLAKGIKCASKVHSIIKYKLKNISRYLMSDKRGALKTILTADPAQPAIPTGATEIDVNLIIEDIHQPRKEFNQDTLRELTETVKLRGVKSPISVRPNPDKPGTYIINHGARRYRASINAGLKTIPAFIDTDYSEQIRVIENLQRDKPDIKRNCRFYRATTGSR